MCEFAETAALVDVLDDDHKSLQERLVGFNNTELLTFFRQVRELGGAIEREYMSRDGARPFGKHHRRWSA
jgi:hypothetical protein